MKNAFTLVTVQDSVSVHMDFNYYLTENVVRFHFVGKVIRVLREPFAEINLEHTNVSVLLTPSEIHMSKVAHLLLDVSPITIAQVTENVILAVSVYVSIKT